MKEMAKKRSVPGYIWILGIYIAFRLILFGDIVFLSIYLLFFGLSLDKM
jgi:hypothetical protein